MLKAIFGTTFLSIALLGVLWSVRIPLHVVPSVDIHWMRDEQVQLFDVQKHKADYELLRKNIRREKSRLSRYLKFAPAENKDEVISHARQYLQNAISQEIVPYWIDTEWDFNGTTESPRDGVIACGYFVTTVLEHAGITLDRVRLAQVASEDLVEAVCAPQSIEKIYQNDYKRFVQYFEKQPDGIYIVGLDTHTGLLEKSGKNLYFIHSRKPRKVGVIRENAYQSKTLHNSKVYVVGNLLDNPKVLQGWLKG